jgi:hypothetical protein
MPGGYSPHNHPVGTVPPVVTGRNTPVVIILTLTMGSFPTLLVVTVPPLFGFRHIPPFLRFYKTQIDGRYRLHQPSGNIPQTPLRTAPPLRDVILWWAQTPVGTVHTTRMYTLQPPVVAVRNDPAARICTRQCLQSAHPWWVVSPNPMGKVHTPFLYSPLQ